MTVYMVTFDLVGASPNTKEVRQAIRDSSTGEWCNYWKSSFLIKSNLSTIEISNNITPYLNEFDTLLVVEAKANYHGRLEKKNWDYIQENIFS